MTHRHAHATGGDALAFIAMWAVMMFAMMLPVVASRLLRYGRERGAAAAAVFASTYYLSWTAAGLVVLPLQSGFAQVSARLPALAGAVAVTALIAVERLAPGGLKWARATGAGLVLFGLSLQASAQVPAG